MPKPLTVQPKKPYDLGPGPLLSFQAEGCEPEIPTSRPADCRGRRVQAGSARSGGGRGADRRNRSSATAGGAGSVGGTPRSRAAGDRAEARGYLLAGAHAAPVPAVAARHFGALRVPRGLTPSSLTAPYYLRPPTKHWQVMRRLGSRHAQVGCLPQATGTPSRPPTPRGARSPDQSRKRRARQTTQRVGKEGVEPAGALEGLAKGR